MKHPKNFYNILFVINDLGQTILKKIDDYIMWIEKDNLVKQRFYNIDFVYMHSIILDIAKLVSATGSDKSGLKQLKTLTTNRDILSKINKFEIKYKDTLKKISANRNKIIAHVDITDMGSYMKMGFSETEIDKKVNDYKKYLNITGKDATSADISTLNNLLKLKATSSGLERYSPSDFSLEIPTLKELVNEIIGIARELNTFFYSLKQ